MSVLAFGIAAAASALLAGISLAVAPSLRAQAQLPMQWGWDGRVTWSAPRGLALAFTPTVGTLALFASAALLGGTPESRAATVGLIGLAFLAGHLLHLMRVRKNASS